MRSDTKKSIPVLAHSEKLSPTAGEKHINNVQQQKSSGSEVEYVPSTMGKTDKNNFPWEGRERLT